MAISISSTAAAHVAEQLADRGHGIGIRVGVKTTGCSGMAYVLEFVDKLEVGDEILRRAGRQNYCRPKKPRLH